MSVINVVEPSSIMASTLHYNIMFFLFLPWREDVQNIDGGKHSFNTQ